MGTAVMLGQDLTEAAGPVRHSALADLQRVTGSWVTVTGKRRESDLLICLHDASPSRSDLALGLRRTHSTLQKRKILRAISSA
jgi:hypothetical protein